MERKWTFWQFCYWVCTVLVDTDRTFLFWWNWDIRNTAVCLKLMSLQEYINCLFYWKVQTHCFICSCCLSYLCMVTVMFVFHYDHHHCADMVFLYINCSEPHLVGRMQEVNKIYAHVQCYVTSCMASCLWHLDWVFIYDLFLDWLIASFIIFLILRWFSQVVFEIYN